MKSKKALEEIQIADGASTEERMSGHRLVIQKNKIKTLPCTLKSNSRVKCQCSKKKEPIKVLEENTLEYRKLL